MQFAIENILQEAIDVLPYNLKDASTIPPDRVCQQDHPERYTIVYDSDGRRMLMM